MVGTNFEITVAPDSDWEKADQMQDTKELTYRGQKDTQIQQSENIGRFAAEYDLLVQDVGSKDCFEALSKVFQEGLPICIEGIGLPSSTSLPCRSWPCCHNWHFPCTRLCRVMR